MRGKVTTITFAAILSTIMFIGSFSFVNADTRGDFENCPPPEGVFVTITVFNMDGSVEGEKTFKAQEYSTENTTEGRNGTVSKLPDEHSNQLNNSVGKHVTVEIVDCRMGEPSYRYKTTMTGGTLEGFSQSGSSSGPPVEKIKFSFTQSTVEYTPVD